LILVFINIKPYKEWYFKNPILCIVDTLCTGNNCPPLRFDRVIGKSPVFYGSTDQCLNFERSDNYDSTIIMFKVSGVIGYDKEELKGGY